LFRTASEHSLNLFRARRAQDKTTPSAKFAKIQVRIAALRARSSSEDVAAFGSQWKDISVVSTAVARRGKVTLSKKRSPFKTILV